MRIRIGVRVMLFHVGPPSGTVTFLFTDIEGSTRLWEAAPEHMRRALERHDTIVSAAIAAHAGSVFSTGGDGFAAAFERADHAVAAAIQAQRDLSEEPWPAEAPIRVRMGLHTGEASERDGDYFGPALNRSARLMAVSHGGQILCSAVTRSIVSDHGSASVEFRDLGAHRLRDLAELEQIFQLVHPGLPPNFPPLRAHERIPGNLPPERTAFIGRESEVAEVRQVLGVARIVTLCGVGGVGKTRLALQVAAEVAPEFPDGAWFVELAGVGSADGVDEAMAADLGVPSRPGVPVGSAVLQYLRNKSLLLVIDNCEHLLSPAAALVDAALREAPGLRVLATSREGLALPGERVLMVPPLELPGSTTSIDEILGSEAIRLFVDRARESNGAFAGDAKDAVAMSELCRRLDGIPLAIELAAARVGSLSPVEITARLDQRFKLLTRGRRTVATRQQTLRNTIDWSYELLEEAERRVFRRLAVFAGDFGLDAAESVVADDDIERFDVVDLLARLVEKCLVAAESESGVTRYRLLETMRDYAWERLEEAGEVDDAAQQHACHFLYYAEMAAEGLEGPDERLWRARVEADNENFRAALRWSIASGDADAALGEVYALSNVFALNATPFGLLVMEAANLPEAAGHPLRAAAVACAAMTMAQQANLEEAAAYVREAETELARHGDAPEGAKFRCRVRGCLTLPVAYSGDAAHLVAIARAELEDGRTINDENEVMRALILLSSVLGDDEYAEAVRAGEEALSIAGRLRVPSYQAWAPMMLATRIASTDPARAERLLDEARTAAIRVENVWAIRMTDQSLAQVQAVQGNYAAATRTMLGLANASLSIGDEGATHSAITGLASLLAAQGDEETALLLGVWAESYGYDPESGAKNATMIPFGGAVYWDVRNRQGSAVLEDVARRAEALDAAQILTLVATQFGAESALQN